MPDHVHLVVEGTDAEAGLAKFIRHVKQLSGYEYRRLTGFRLWQESYHDRTLRSDESLPDLIGYVIANPVRAGLAKVPEEYPHWGSGVWSREELLDYVSCEKEPRV